MAIAANRMTAWVWQATAADRRTGFVEMTRAEFTAAGARAQDPRVGALHLKHIVRALYVDPGTRQAPAPAPDATQPYRRAAAAAAAELRERRNRKPGA
jgi:hypothetical protein